MPDPKPEVEQATPAAEPEASGARIQALEKSIAELRQENAEIRNQLKNTPQYLDQSDHSLWP